MLRDKHIVVTGASRGMGRAIAFEAAKNGAKVGINFFNNGNDAKTLFEEIERSGFPPPLLLRFDATSPREIKEGIGAFLEEFGRIDGWVNNAAVNLSGLLPVLSEDEIRAQINSALLGPIFCCRALVPVMMKNRGGSIVNIGSVVTEKAFRGQSVYAAAKGGLLSFTRAFAIEYGRKGIRINCVQPGPVETEMLKAAKNLAGTQILKQIPLQSFPLSGDIAALVVFLLSDLSSSITGAHVNIDGGYSL